MTTSAPTSSSAGLPEPRAAQPRINELEPEYHDGAAEQEDDEDEDDRDNAWDDWIDDGDDDQDESGNGVLNQPTKSLFSEQILPSPEEALAHDKAQTGFDLVQLVADLHLDLLQSIKLVNYIRAAVSRVVHLILPSRLPHSKKLNILPAMESQNQKPSPDELQDVTAGSSFLADDRYLTPTLRDDPLLQLDIEDMADSLAPSTSTAHPAAAERALRQQVSALQQQLQIAQGAIAEQREFLEKQFAARYLGGESPTDAAAARLDKGKGKKRDDDTHYFHSYSANEIHEIMLKDRVRTESYQNFILNNTGLFKDAVVLDVGCGTGILSLFCAKAGAKRVYAVDASDVAYKAQRSVKENGYDNVIKVIKGKLEDLPDEELDNVDIIVSEWMGYFLLYESMLDSVLRARDRFLKPDGLMVPSQCSILLAAVQDHDFVKSSVDYWDSVYGFKMSSMKDDLAKEAEVLIARPGTIISNVASIKDVLARTDGISDCDFSCAFTMEIKQKGTVHGFLGWFDTFFTVDNRQVSGLAIENDHVKGALAQNEVAFTTGPRGEPTHWKQTFFLLKEFVQVEEGQRLQGTFMCRKSKDNSRELEVEVVFTTGQANRAHTQAWVVS